MIQYVNLNEDLLQNTLHLMKSYKTKEVKFDRVEVNYPLMIIKLFVKKILWNFCTIYKIIYHSSKCIYVTQWS